MADGRFEALGDARQRMLGDVETEQLLLPVEPLLAFGQRSLRQHKAHAGRCGVRRIGKLVEQRELSGLPGALLGLGHAQRTVQPLQESGPLAEIVESAGFNHAFERAAIELTQVHPPAQVGQVRERATFLAGLDKVADGCSAEVLDRRQPETDRRPVGALRSVGDLERQPTVVHARWQQRYLQAPAFCRGLTDFRRVAGGSCQNRRQVFDRIVGLQVSGLIGHHRIVGGVPLGKPIAGERLDQLPQRLGKYLVVAALYRTGHELTLLLGHERGDLLAHGFAEHVGLAPREPGNLAGNLEHLILVDDDPVGLLQQGLQVGMEIGNLFGAVLRGHEIGNALHRPWPIESHNGDQVRNLVGPQLLETPPHAAGLQLEHGRRLPLGQHVVGPLGPLVGVVHRQRFEIKLLTPVLAHEPHGPVEDGEVGKAEEVHLQQTDLFDDPERPLGNAAQASFLVVFRRPLQRHVLDQGVGGDDDGRGVGGGVARRAFQRLGQLDQFFDLRLLGHEVLHVGHVARRGQVRAERDRLGHPVHLAIAHPQDTAHIADGSPRRHRAEGDDLRDVIGTVLLGHVLDDLAAPVVGEVHVNVGHAQALVMQEPLEHDVVFERVNVGDAQAVDNDAAGHRSARVG